MQLHRARSDIEASGGALVFIGQATPRHAAHFRRRHGVEATVLADEDRRTYKAAGAKKATVGELIGPRVVAKGVATSLRTGKVQGRTIGHPAQLGGVMVITPGGEVPWSHMSEDASDNATPEQIVEALRAARR